MKIFEKCFFKYCGLEFLWKAKYLKAKRHISEREEIMIPVAMQMTEKERTICQMSEREYSCQLSF